MNRAVLVPGVLALLPEYAGLGDPVAELRAACLAAVGWLGAEGPVSLHGSAQGARVARHLAHAAGVAVADTEEPGERVVVVANGSAARTEKAPGHLHPRAAAFDDRLGAALLGPDPAVLASLDLEEAEHVWADVESLVWLGAHVLDTSHRARVDYDADPFGVQYWVVRWSATWSA